MDLEANAEALYATMIKHVEEENSAAVEEEAKLWANLHNEEGVPQPSQNGNDQVGVGREHTFILFTYS